MTIFVNEKKKNTYQVTEFIGLSRSYCNIYIYTCVLYVYMYFNVLDKIEKNAKTL